MSTFLRHCTITKSFPKKEHTKILKYLFVTFPNPPPSLPCLIPMWKTIFHSTGCLLKFDCIEKQALFLVPFRGSSHTHINIYSANSVGQHTEKHPAT